MKVKFLLLSSLIALSACSGEHGDLQDWMREQRDDAKTKITPVEPPAPLEHTAYFAPPSVGTHAFDIAKMRSATQNANMPDMDRPKEILENYSLENIKFKGSIGTKQKMAGLVEVDGHTYTVRPGNYLGQNYGRISKITADGIELIEVVEDAEGNWINRPATLSAEASESNENKK
ncbi:MAG: pilus assembly protein PilP [Neisseriaceae bacterium]|nr:pilus assembly protein PilP [Neisseriaceae bacterium]